MRNDAKSPIPQYTALKKKGIIPETAAQLPQSKNPEDEKFVISFKYYRDDLCEIVNLQKNGGRRALKNLRVIGNCYNKASLKESNIDITAVKNAGNYTKLYSSLEHDIELLEHKIQSTARIFYFIAGKTFCVRAITNTHLETNKHR